MDQVRAGLSTVMAPQGQRFMADAAQDARVHVVGHVALEARRGRLLSRRGTGWSPACLNSDFERHLSQFERIPCPAYLSVQLMQGSMVSTIILTSARSHPASAVAMPARFCEVGVRMRMRSRYFDPLPRA